MCQIRYTIHVKTFPVANEWSTLKHECGSTIFTWNLNMYLHTRLLKPALPISPFDLPENLTKPKVFWYFHWGWGGQKRKSGRKGLSQSSRRSPVMSLVIKGQTNMTDTCGLSLSINYSRCGFSHRLHRYSHLS